MGNVSKAIRLTAIVLFLLVGIIGRVSAVEPVSKQEAREKSRWMILWGCANPGRIRCCCEYPEKGIFQTVVCSFVQALGYNCNQSYADSVAFSHHHYATDYGLKGASGACSSCGASGGGKLDLPSFKLTRIHKPRQAWLGSSFGPGVFCNFDTRMQINRTNETTGTGKGMFVGHTMNRNLSLSETSSANGDDSEDGVLWNNSHQAIGPTRLLDANGQLTADQRLAVTATITTHTGKVQTFELIRTDPDPAATSQWGRLIKLEDRNGNAIDITYAYPASATDEQLGNDRSKLWMLDTVTDAYNQVATFHYHPTQYGGRWCIASVDLPNNETISYHYGATSGKLEQVDHPDGTSSTFGYSVDAYANHSVIAYSDPAAPAGHQHKAGYYTLANWVDPNDPNHVVAQSEGGLRMVVNADDEVSYMAWQASESDNERLYIYEGGNQLKQHKSTAYYPQYDGVATDWDLDTDPSTWTFEKTFSYQYNTARMITKKTDNLGRETRHGYNTANGDRTSQTYPDGTTKRWTFNGSRQPTFYKDRLDRVTTWTYDANGNRLSQTVGQALDAQENVISTPVTATRSWTYTANGQLATATDFNNNVTNYYYSSTGDPAAIDGSGYLVKIVEPPDEAGGPRAEHLFTYDGVGRIYSTEDPIGREVRYGYDECNRNIEIHYIEDDSYENFNYHYTGDHQGLLANRIDRNDNRTDFGYDNTGRQISITRAANNPAIALVTTVDDFLNGTRRPLSRTSAGNTTTYVYDFRNRRTSRSVKPNSATTLTSSTVYDDARRVAYTQDAYGRKTYNYYDPDTDFQVRTVRESIPGTVEALFGGIPTQEQLAGLARDDEPNPDYIITDSVFDAERQTIKRIDPRGTVSTIAYDQRGRSTIRIAVAAYVPLTATSADIQAGTSETAITDIKLMGKTEALYDAQSNVVESRGPRYFDPADTTGYQKDRTTVVYNGRNRTKTTTQAPGTTVASATSQTYTLDGLPAIATDGRNNDWESKYHGCCARPLADIDPTGAATITNNDQYGNTIYSALVDDFATCGDPHAPTGTLREISTRFDGRHRPIARTVWLTTPQAFLAALTNPHDSGGGLNVPIADRTTNPVANATHAAGTGLTTTWEYDDDLADGIGIDAITALQPIIALANLGTGATGSAVAITDPEGATSYQISDGLGRSVLAIDADGDVVQRKYDSVVAGLVISETIVDPDWTGYDGLALSTEAHSDGAGNIRQAVDAIDEISLATFDANGNRLTSRDPNLNGTDCTYDRRNRKTLCKTLCEDTFGDTVHDVDFDAAGNVIISRDGLAQPTAYAFDAKGRRISQVDRNAGITAYYHDANNNQIAIVDDDEFENLSQTATVGQPFFPPALQTTWNATRYVYDVRNLLETESFPGHDATSSPGDPGYDRKNYIYDAARQLVSREDQKGDETTYDYDLAGRLTNRGYPDNQDDSFVYDLASRLVSAACPRYNNLVHREYTPAGKIEAETLTIAGRAYTTGYGYDPAGRKTSTTYPSTQICQRTFTDRSQLESVTLAGEVIANFVYDAGGRETQRTLGNNLVETRTWRDDNLVATISCPGVVDFGYTYDANQRKTSEADGILGDYSQGFGYDDEDRLVDWSRIGTDPGAPRAQQWDLSLVGDMNTITTDGTNENRLHSAVHEITDLDSAAPEHDAKGNLTFDPKRGNSYYWDYENRLAHVANPARAAILLHWPLDENAGTTAGDAATATVRDGTISGPTWNTAGQSGSCLEFAGSGDSVLESTAPNYLNGLSAITVALWVKSDATNVDRGIFDTEGADGQDDEMNLRYDKSGWGGGGSNLIKCSLKTTAGQTAIESANDTQTTGWQHLVMVWQSGGNLKLYIDGVETTTTYDEGALGGTITGVDQFLLGRACKNQTWDGLLDDVQVYDYALSPATIAALYRRPAAPISSSYAYDALGRRVNKSVGSMVTDYALSGSQVIEEYTGAGMALDRSYAYGVYIDEALAVVVEGDEAYYYHRNHLYSVSALTNSSGNVDERYAYDAYGVRYPRNSNGSLKTSGVIQEYGFTGRRHDPESGLMYFRARYYDDSLGRFLGRDPLGYVDGLNLYSAYYVPNMVDAYGLATWEELGNNIWEALVDGASLQELSALVLGHTRDWQCIWPVPEWKKPKDYPKAKRCDKADVSNLVDTSTRKMWFVNSGEPSFEGGLPVWWGPWSPVYTESTGTAAAKKMKERAQSGATPISYLAILTHGDMVYRHYYGVVTTMSKDGLGVDDLKAASDQNSYSRDNEYKFAKKKSGPVKCWFQRNARIDIVGCGTSGTASDWAANTLRKPGNARGTTAPLEFGLGWLGRSVSVVTTGSTYYGSWGASAAEKVMTDPMVKIHPGKL